MRCPKRSGRANIFCDIKSIGPGSDLELDIREWLAQCDVVLVVIGELWATVRDERNRRRIAEPDDPVRKEIEFALAHDLLVVPVLVGNGTLPSSDELPPRMRKLLRRNAHVLSVKHFDADLDDLVGALQRLGAHAALDEAHARHAPASQGGAELTTVRDNLRHASLATTSMYLHTDDARRDQAGGRSVRGAAVVA